MDIELNAAQKAVKIRFREFVNQHIAPTAAEYDRRQETPKELVQTMADEGCLGGMIPEQYGGGGMDALSWGIMCEEVSNASASLLSLLTVHTMVIQALLKWGSEEQRRQWLPRMASGEIIGGFGLTEIKTGSDARNAKTIAVADGNEYILNGRKRWISFGQFAGLFLILAQVEGKPTAFLVERERDGFTTEPITGMLGFRSARDHKALLPMTTSGSTPRLAATCLRQTRSAWKRASAVATRVRKRSIV